jgi:divalent metal cation (Fe/Co/Zn/Cd) transporter
MLANLGFFNIVAVGLYLLVALSGVAGLFTAVRFRQAGWHLRVWLFVIVLFIVLTALRGLGLEDMWQSELRAMMRADGAYQDRREFQRPLAAIVVAFGGIAAFIWAYRGFRNVRGRRNVAAMVAAASGTVMIALVALRMISLHPVDALLYGPVKLNWIIDIGSSLIVLVAAVYYLRLVTRRP